MARIIKALWLASTFLACAGTIQAQITDDSVMSDFAVTAATVVHCVKDAGELQAALLEAQSNGQNDVIRLVRGQYDGNFGYSSDEPRYLMMLGGYNENCGSRVVDPVNTVLDGGVQLTSSRAANFAIEGLTQQRWGVGILVQTRGQVLLTKNLVRGNFNGGGVLIFAFKATLRDNTVEDNRASQGVGGIGVSATISELTGNIVRRNYDDQEGQPA